EDFKSLKFSSNYAILLSLFLHTCVSLCVSFEACPIGLKGLLGRFAGSGGARWPMTHICKAASAWDAINARRTASSAVISGRDGATASRRKRDAGRTCSAPLGSSHALE